MHLQNFNKSFAKGLRNFIFSTTNMAYNTGTKFKKQNTEEQIMNNYEQVKVEHIRQQYMEQKPTKLDVLKELDKKVKRPAQIFTYTFGTIGSLVLGTGMCLAMKIIGDMMALGIVVGVVGIAMVSVNYPLYKKILNSRKKKYGKEIIELSNELLHE